MLLVPTAAVPRRRSAATSAVAVPVVGFGVNVAVTPAGRFSAANVTSPVKIRAHKDKGGRRICVLRDAQRRGSERQSDAGRRRRRRDRDGERHRLVPGNGRCSSEREGGRA